MVVDDVSRVNKVDVTTRMQMKIQQRRAMAQQSEIANEVDIYFNDSHHS